MFNNILVPTDGSPLSEIAIRAAVKFAAETGAKIVAISVANPHEPFAPIVGGIPLDPDFYDEHIRREFAEQPQKIAKKNVNYVYDIARDAGVSCETLTVTSADPYKEIVNAVDAYKCDLIFMASHGRKGLNRLILGSETQKVIAYSTVPVLVFR